MPFNAPGEYTLTVTTTETQFAGASDVDAVINVQLDCSTMTVGDVITFRLYSKTFIADSTARILWKETVSGPLPADVLLGGGMSFDVRTGWRLTAQKESGTDRSIRAAIQGIS